MFGLRMFVNCQDSFQRTLIPDEIIVLFFLDVLDAEFDFSEITVNLYSSVYFSRLMQFFAVDFFKKLLADAELAI